jgi:hypothetical protein
MYETPIDRFARLAAAGQIDPTRYPLLARVAALSPLERALTIGALGEAFEVEDQAFDEATRDTAGEG